MKYKTKKAYLKMLKWQMIASANFIKTQSRSKIVKGFFIKFSLVTHNLNSSILKLFKKVKEKLNKFPKRTSFFWVIQASKVQSDHNSRQNQK